MNKSRPVAQNIFIWTYERGTLSYDILCILILAFIFLVPPSCFHKKQNTAAPKPDQPSQFSQPADTVSDQRDSDHVEK
jgi:hypothetical protein